MIYRFGIALSDNLLVKMYNESLKGFPTNTITISIRYCKHSDSLTITY